ncbi:hypothetical protein [Pseudomonas baltica]|uniref:hypothetical protein n=1 Tax=Pseudomonas baltica TaxID=2762576 RepID=UPI00289C8913|nr:hypothetical protein [Pseudomonas baltica]
MGRKRKSGVSLNRLWRRLWHWVLHDNMALLPAPRADTLPDIEGGEHNLLSKQQVRADLRLEFDLWQYSEPTVQYPDVLQLFLDDRPAAVATRSWGSPIQADELFIMLDRIYLTEGLHSVYYRVTLGLSGVSGDSQVFSFVVDTTSPDLGDNRGRLVFPPDAATDITARYLELNGDQVVAQVPEYYPVRVGDMLTPYWEQAAVGSLAQPDKVLGVGDLGKPIELTFTGAQIRALGDGQRYATYRVTDRAGNESNLSAAVELNVSAAPLPRYWPAPQVRDSSNGGVSNVLDPTKALTGVTVWVPANAAFNPDEIASIYWGTPGTTGAAQTQARISGTGPWRGFITKEQVAACIGKALVITYGLLNHPELPASDPLRLIVSVIDQQYLPQVQSQAAINNSGRISLSTLTAGDTITLRPWPLISTTQKIRLWAEGTGQNGLASEYVMLDATPVTSGQINSGVSVALPKPWLQTLRSNSALALYVRVSFDAGENWVAFPASGRITVVA